MHGVKVVLLTCIFHVTFGVRVTELRYEIGIEACKERCLTQSECLAILYDIVHITCEVQFSRRQSSRLSKTLAFIPRSGIVTEGKESYRSKPCCITGSCIVTHSDKQICRIPGCPECMFPPQKANCDVTITQLYHGAVAKYTCQPSFSFSNKRSKHLLCYRNCTWERADFHLRRVIKQEHPTSNYKLDMPFTVNTTVYLCGSIEKPPRMSIAFTKGGTTYFEIKHKFDFKDLFTIRFKLRLPGAKKTSNKFFFKWFSRFCLNVTRKYEKYTVKMKEQEFHFADTKKGAADTVVPENVAVTRVRIQPC